MVVRRGVLLAAVGLASGLALSLPLVRLLRTVLFGVSPFDAWTFIAAAAVLLAVSLLASAIPARRAGSLDPVAALRVE
jgi:ABC-type antimicrobial peptide transport system permease subunit